MGDHQMFMGDQNNSSEQFWLRGGQSFSHFRHYSLHNSVFVVRGRNGSQTLPPQSGDNSPTLTPRVHTKADSFEEEEKNLFSFLLFLRQ